MSVLRHHLFPPSTVVGYLVFCQLLHDYRYRFMFGFFIIIILSYLAPPCSVYSVRARGRVVNGRDIIPRQNGHGQHAVSLMIRDTSPENTPDEPNRRFCYDVSGCLAWLNRAYEARAGRLVFVKVDPYFDSLHSDPQFRDLLQRMKLEP